MSRKLISLAIGGVTALLVMQAFRLPRHNPPSDPATSFEAVVSPPEDVRRAVGRACRDCHSNETAWPWYSAIAPVSWLVVNDVKRARAELNLSDWGHYGPGLSQSRVADMCEEVTSGEMPLWYFTLVHPRARLSRAEISSLCALPAARRAAAPQPRPEDRP